MGGASAAWPLAARAQQPERVRKIGVLMHATSDEPESQARIVAFAQGLQEAGWSVGRNVRIETRWSTGDASRLRRDAAELVALAPDVVLAGVGATIPALLEASRTVPVVFAQGLDPVGAGYSGASSSRCSGGRRRRGRLWRAGSNQKGYGLSEF